jgi:L-gulonate 5-dehydrogenase
MKAVLLESPKSIKIKHIDMPRRKKGEALIKIKAAGICGSDIGAYRGDNPLVSYPRIIGHEIAGEIIEIDDNKKNLKAGDHIILDPYIYCGKCYPCSIGRTNCCENLKVIGVHIDGGMQEYISYPTNMLVPVSDTIAWEHVPLAEPVTIALHAIHRVRLKEGEHIAINGAGAIGILIALCAKAYGAVPILVDIVGERLEFAKSLGIKDTINISNQDMLKTLSEMTSGRMAETVVEASGSNAAIRNSLDMASYAGRIAFTGWPKKETLLPTDRITKKELDIYGSRTSAGEFEEAIDLITSGKINAQSIISKVVSLDDIPRMVIDISEHPDQYLKVNVLF